MQGVAFKTRIGIVRGECKEDLVAHVPALPFTCKHCNARLGGCTLCLGTGRQQSFVLVPGTGRAFYLRLKKRFQPPAPVLRLVFKDGEAVERALD